LQDFAGLFGPTGSRPDTVPDQREQNSGTQEQDSMKTGVFLKQKGAFYMPPSIGGV